ncbi:DNA polymerase III subunit gamma and tau [Okibacterium endophyticum]
MVTALYRRYRPENFAEMIGQSQVTDPLMTALRSDRVNHAYLFSGPRGCGKTTSARILARCLNCVEGPTDNPCGTCPSCIELSRAGGGSLDVVEIDAASHNGVDDARDLRERAIFAPARDRYKIFILDEAHMVTPQGFNALLKIVEEPPEHVKFIFATTEPDKVIGTIRSRTHHYPFRLIPPAQMLEYVQSLCDAEGVSVEAGVLPLVVRAGGGSARDTLSLLDQLMAGSEGDSVDYERAVALLGYTHASLLDEVIDALSATDAGAAFSAVDRVIQTGQDPRRFVDDLLERLRDLIVVGATGDGAAAVLRGIPQDELDHMAVQASAFGSAELSRTADIVNTALSEMTGATSPRLHLELMVARVLVPAMDDTHRGALARVERLERRVGVEAGAGSAGASPADARSATPATSATSAAPEVPAAARQPAAAPPAPATASPPRQKQSAASDASEAASAVAAEAPAPASAQAPSAGGKAAEPTSAAVGPVTLQQMKDAWPQILDRVSKVKRSAWLVATTATVRDFNADHVLRLSFPSRKDAEDFKQLTAGEGVSSIVRHAISDVLGVSVKFIAQVEPGSGGAGPNPAGDPSPGGVPAGPREGRDAQTPERDAPAPAARAQPAPAASSRAGDDLERPSATSSAVTSSAATAAAATRVAPAPAAAPATPSASRAPGATSGESGPASAPSVGWNVVAIPQTDDDPPSAHGSSASEPVTAASAVTEMQSDLRASSASPLSSGAYGEPDDADAPPPDDEPPYPDPADDPMATRTVTPIPPRAPVAPAAPLTTDTPEASGSTTPAPTTPAPTTPAPSTPGPSSAPAAATSTGDRRPAHPAGASRYGEAVVRELLGATFIEEQPHTPRAGFNR